MWKTISSKVIHKNNWYRIVHNKFVLPNKKRGEHFILETNGCSIVVPVKGDKIILEKQYRYPIKKWSIELPCGGVEKGSNFLATAKKELLEEIGYKTGKITEIGSFAPFPGKSSQICKVYIATQLKYTESNTEDFEIIKSMEVEIKKVYDMIGKGKIIDGLTLSALALVRKYLLKK